MGDIEKARDTYLWMRRDIANARMAEQDKRMKTDALASTLGLIEAHHSEDPKGTEEPDWCTCKLCTGTRAEMEQRLKEDSLKTADIREMKMGTEEKPCDPSMIQIHFSPEDSGYIATAPAYKNLSAFGVSYEEALRECKVAKEGYFECKKVLEDDPDAPTSKDHELQTLIDDCKRLKGSLEKLTEGVDKEEPATPETGDKKGLDGILENVYIRFDVKHGSRSAPLGACITQAKQEIRELLDALPKGDFWGGAFYVKRDDVLKALNLEEAPNE